MPTLDYVPTPTRKMIGIVGSRRRATANDFVYTLAAFDLLYQAGDSIVSGGYWKGGDRFAEDIARSRKVPITIHRADWNGPDGRAAGFVRNTLIAEDCSILIALVAPDRTGGTEDTIRKTEKLGKWIILL